MRTVESTPLIELETVNSDTTQSHRNPPTEQMDPSKVELGPEKNVLHLAIQDGDHRKVKGILEAASAEQCGTLIIAQTDKSTFPHDTMRSSIHLAIKYCDSNILTVLLKYMDPNSEHFQSSMEPDSKGNTPLNLAAKHYHYAQKNDDKKKLNILINTMTNIQELENKKALLIKALQANLKGNTPLFYLSKVVDTKIFRQLIQACISTNSIDTLPLDCKLIKTIVSYSFYIPIDKRYRPYLRWEALALGGAIASGTTLALMIIFPLAGIVLAASKGIWCMGGLLYSIGGLGSRHYKNKHDGDKNDPSDRAWRPLLQKETIPALLNNLLQNQYLKIKSLFDSSPNNFEKILLEHEKHAFFSGKKSFLHKAIQHQDIRTTLLLLSIIAKKIPTSTTQQSSVQYAVKELIALAQENRLDITRYFMMALGADATHLTTEKFTWNPAITPAQQKERLSAMVQPTTLWLPIALLEPIDETQQRKAEREETLAHYEATVFHSSHRNPLIEALNQQQWDIATLILNHCAEPHILLNWQHPETGRTLSHYAVHSGRLDILEALKSYPKAPTNFSLTDKEGRTVLHYAILYNALNIQTPFRAPSHPDRLSILNYVLDNLNHSHAIDTLDAYHWTALHYAAANTAYHQHFKTLLQQGANIMPTTQEGESALHLLLRSLCVNLHEDFDALDKLLHRGGDVNGPDNRGQTSLHIAVIARHVTLCHHLLAHQANPNIATYSNITAPCANHLPENTLTTIHFHSITQQTACTANTSAIALASKLYSHDGKKELFPTKSIPSKQVPILDETDSSKLSSLYEPPYIGQLTIRADSHEEYHEPQLTPLNFSIDPIEKKGDCGFLLLGTSRQNFITDIEMVLNDETHPLHQFTVDQLAIELSQLLMIDNTQDVNPNFKTSLGKQIIQALQEQNPNIQTLKDNIDATLEQCKRLSHLKNYLGQYNQSFVDADNTTHQLWLGCHAAHVWARIKGKQLFIWTLEQSDDRQHTLTLNKHFNPNLPQYHEPSILKPNSTTLHALWHGASSQEYHHFDALSLTVDHTEAVSMQASVSNGDNDELEALNDENQAIQHRAIELGSIEQHLRQLETQSSTQEESEFKQAIRHLQTQLDDLNETVEQVDNTVHTIEQDLKLPEKRLLRQQQQIILHNRLDRAYYNTVRSLFNVYCSSASLINGGMIRRANYTRTGVAGEGLELGLELAEQALHLIPGAGILLPLLKSSTQEALYAASKALDLSHLSTEWQHQQHQAHHHLQRSTPQPTQSTCDNLDSWRHKLDYICSFEESVISRMALLTNSPRELEKTVEIIARKLTQRYRQQIRRCTPEGATQFAECSVNRIVHYLKKGHLHAATAYNPRTQQELIQELVACVAIPALNQTTTITLQNNQTVTEQALHSYSGLQVIATAPQVYSTFYQHSRNPDLQGRINPESYGWRHVQESELHPNELTFFGWVTPHVEQGYIGPAQPYHRGTPVGGAGMAVSNTSPGTKEAKEDNTTDNDSDSIANLKEKVDKLREKNDELNTRIEKNESITRANLSFIALNTSTHISTLVAPLEIPGNRHGENLETARLLREQYQQIQTLSSETTSALPARHAHEENNEEEARNEQATPQ